jgi:hypothetical protein
MDDLALPDTDVDSWRFGGVTTARVLKFFRSGWLEASGITGRFL